MLKIHYKSSDFALSTSLVQTDLKILPLRVFRSNLLQAIHSSDELPKVSSLFFFNESSLILLHSYSLQFFRLTYLLSCFFCVLCLYALVFLSQQIVLEDLRPVLTDQVQLQSSRSVQHRLESPAQNEGSSTSSRPAQVVLGCGHWETLFVHSLIPAWTHWSASTCVYHLISAPSGG